MPGWSRWSPLVQGSFIPYNIPDFPALPAMRCKPIYARRPESEGRRMRAAHPQILRHGTRKTSEEKNVRQFYEGDFGRLAGKATHGPCKQTLSLTSEIARHTNSGGKHRRPRLVECLE